MTKTKWRTTNTVLSISITVILVFAITVSYPQQASAATKLDWSNFDPSKIDWGKIDLSGIDNSEIDWQKIDLSQVDRSLLESVLVGLDIDWSEIDWSEIDLSEVDVSEIDWEKMDWEKTVGLVTEFNASDTESLDALPLINTAYAFVCGGACTGAIIAAIGTIIVALIAAFTKDPPIVNVYINNNCGCDGIVVSPMNPGNSGGGGPETPIGSIALATSILAVVAAFALWSKRRALSSPLVIQR